MCSLKIFTFIIFICNCSNSYIFSVFCFIVSPAHTHAPFPVHATPTFVVTSVPTNISVHIHALICSVQVFPLNYLAADSNVIVKTIFETDIYDFFDRIIASDPGWDRDSRE